MYKLLKEFNELEAKYSSEKSTKVEFLNFALSNKKGKSLLKGFYEKDGIPMTTGGASINKSHNSSLNINFPKKELVEVETISAKDLMNDLTNKYDIIILKLDIESEEYNVLNEIIDNGLDKKIDKFYVEWHSKYMIYEDKVLYKRIERKIKNKLKNKISPWI